MAARSGSLAILKPIPTQEPHPEEAPLMRKLASGAFALFIAAVYEYLSLAGVFGMNPARAALIFAWAIGVLGVCASRPFQRRPGKGRVLIGALSGVVLAASLFGLDQWTVHWKKTHGLEDSPGIAKLQNSVNSLHNDIEMIPQKGSAIQSGTSPLSRANPKAVIAGALGFLRMQIDFADNKLFQADKSINIRVANVNMGATMVHNAAASSNLYLVTVGDSSSLDDEVKRRFDEDKPQFVHPIDLGPLEDIWVTRKTKPLDSSLIQGILSGAVRLYIFNKTQWTAGGKLDSASTCVYMQAPESASQSGIQAIWHIC
ncbi:MAG: hypothetical protein ACR2JE_13350 [Acidobacteriaceae bacterium]